MLFALWLKSLVMFGLFAMWKNFKCQGCTNIFPENFHEKRVKLLAERGPSTNMAAMMSATSQQ